MLLNINQLRAFYTAAKLGSITKAARELMVTPPAITIQVKQLEKNAGVELFFHEGNNIRLAEMGEVVFKYAENIFSEIRVLENFFKDVSIGKSGDLRIGCTQTCAKCIMPPLITVFKKSYPGLKIILDQRTNTELVKSLLEHKNELVLVRNIPVDKRLKIKIIGKSEVVLTTARESVYFPSGITSVSELSSAPLIVPEEGSATRDVIFEYFRRFKVTPFVAIESGNREFAKKLVCQDNVVGFFERYDLDDSLKKVLREVPIMEGSPFMEFGFGYLNRKKLSPAAWAFMRFLDKSKDLLLSFIKP